MGRAVIYTRISYDKNGDLLAVERQHEDCESIISRRGWELVGEYSDNSISASKKNVRRPEYERMIADFDAGLFDAMVCYDLDRLTRQPRQLEDWIDRATEHGLKLVTANGEADLTTDSGRLFARIKAAVAREEIERKGARQRRANRQRAERGVGLSYKPCFGYTSSNKVVPEEAEVVRDLFQRFAAGETVYGLGEWLKEHGPSPKQGKRWSRTTLRGMLTNPRYVARVVYRGNVLPVKGTWEPIVTDDLFDTVQSILADPRRKLNKGQTARKHLLSGIAVCGTCGETVRGSGYAYVCTNRCHSKATKLTNEFITQVVEERLSTLEPFTPDAEIAPEVAEKITVLRNRLTTIEADYDNGLIDGRRFATATEKVNAQLQELERQRVTNSGRTAASKILQEHDPAKAFHDSSLAIRRAVVDAMLTITLQPRTGAVSHNQFDYDSINLEWKI